MAMYYIPLYISNLNGSLFDKEWKESKSWTITTTI